MMILLLGMALVFCSLLLVKPVPAPGSSSRELEGVLCAIIDSLPDAIVVRRADCTEIVSNSLYRSVSDTAFQYQGDFLISGTLSDVLSSIEKQASDAQKPILSRIRRYNDEIVHHFQVMTTRLSTTDESSGPYLSVISDISDLQQANEDLESQQRILWHIGELSSLLLQSGKDEALIKQAMCWMGEKMGLVSITINEHVWEENDYIIHQQYVWKQNGSSGDFSTKKPNKTYESPIREHLGELDTGRMIQVAPPAPELSGIATLPSSIYNHTLLVPIRVGKEFIGVLQIESDRISRKWSSIESSVLSATAIIFGQFIQRKRMFSSLRWNEALLSTMVSSSPLGFFVVDNRTDNILFANERFCQIWGLSSISQDIYQGKVKNNDIIPYCIPILKDPVAFGESCKPLQDEENRECIDDEIPFVDGRIIRRYSTQIRGINDEYFGRFYIFEDITEKKAAEQEIREREEELQAIFDNQQAMLIIDGESRRISKVNLEAVQLIGLPRDQIEGRICHQFICPAERDNCPIMDLHKEVDRSERLLLSQARGTIPVIKSVHKITLNNKTYLIESFTDISERKKNEENLQKINTCLLSFGPEPLENIIKLAYLARDLLGADYAAYTRMEKGSLSIYTSWQPEGSFVIYDHPNGSIFQEILSLRTEEVSTISDISHDMRFQSEPALQELTVRSYLGKGIRTGQEYIGSLHLFYHESSSFTPAMGYLLSVIAAAIGMEEERKKALDQLNDFAYIISHDLKTPLRGISSLAGWLKEDYASCLPPEGIENLNLMNARVVRMQNLINGVLEYSRVGRLQEKKENISIRDLLNEIRESISIPSGSTLIIPETLPVVQADRTQLTQVFENLISNAIKYAGRQDAIVEISATHDDGYHIFGVRDNGPGIDPRYHEKIFQIFQTLQQKKDGDSTGVGLTIVRKIVEHWGGRIRIESESGSGSTFYFSLPDTE